MALNIKNPEVENLAREVARLFRETKTQAIYQALLERKQRGAARLPVQNSRERLENILSQEVWAHVPAELLGRVVTKDELETILGYGERGV